MKFTKNEYNKAEKIYNIYTNYFYKGDPPKTETAFECLQHEVQQAWIMVIRFKNDKRKKK